MSELYTFFYAQRDSFCSSPIRLISHHYHVLHSPKFYFPNKWQPIVLILHSQMSTPNSLQCMQLVFDPFGTIFLDVVHLIPTFILSYLDTIGTHPHLLAPKHIYKLSKFRFQLQTCVESYSLSLLFSFLSFFRWDGH